VNIPAHFSAIVERFVGELVLDLKDADFIRNQKNGFYACSDCGKPMASACGRCPDHVRGYYVTQYYNRLRSESLQSEMQERLRLVIQEIQERLRSETRERTYEKIMVAHRDKLAILNIILCRECLLPIKMEEGEYCDNCRPK
jgi:hypothetical protein